MTKLKYRSRSMSHLSDMWNQRQEKDNRIALTRTLASNRWPKRALSFRLGPVINPGPVGSNSCPTWREPSPATDLDGIMACQGWGLLVVRTVNGFVTVVNPVRVICADSDDYCDPNRYNGILPLQRSHWFPGSIPRRELCVREGSPLSGGPMPKELSQRK